MKIPFPVVQISVVGHERVPLPLKCHRIAIWPNEHRNHISYGDMLTTQWRYFKGESGMLWIEGDIAVTPEHLTEIVDATLVHPGCVVAVPYLLYPATTQRPYPMWSNQGATPMGLPVAYDGIAPHPIDPAFFSLGCTFLPAYLLDRIDMRAGNWDYPCLDTRLSELAQALRVRCIATVTPALHLHY